MNGLIAYDGETQSMPAGAAGSVDLAPFQLSLVPTFVERRTTPTYFAYVVFEHTVVGASANSGQAGIAIGTDWHRAAVRYQWMDGRDKIVDIRGINLLRLNMLERGQFPFRVPGSAVGVQGNAAYTRRFYDLIAFRLEGHGGGINAEKQEDHEYLVASNSRGQILVTIDPTALTQLGGTGMTVTSHTVTPTYLLSVRPGAPVAWIYEEIGELTRSTPDFTVPGGGYRSLCVTDRNNATTANFPDHGVAVFPTVQIEGGKRIDRDTGTRRVLTWWDLQRWHNHSRQTVVGATGGDIQQSLTEQQDAASPTIPLLPLLYPTGRDRLSRMWWANEAGHRVRLNGATRTSAELTFRRCFANIVKAEAQRDAFARASIDPAAWDRGLSKSESKKRNVGGLREFLPRKAA